MSKKAEPRPESEWDFRLASFIMGMEGLLGVVVEISGFRRGRV